MLLTCTGSCSHKLFKLAVRWMIGMANFEEEHLSDALISNG